MPRFRLPLLALPLLLAADAQEPRTPSALADLAWLAGTWRAVEEDGSFHEESWSQPLGDAMAGMYRAADADGRITLFELMSLELDAPPTPAVEGDGPLIPGQTRGGAPARLVYRLRHFDRGLAPWRSEESGPMTMQVVRIGEQELQLEAPERDFPRTASYRREGDRLHIELRAADPDGTRLSFVLDRVDV